MGSDIDDGDELAPNYAWAYDALGMDTVYRMTRAYGTRIEKIIGPYQAPAELGREIAPGLFEAELHYLIDHEFARCAEDVLWRRSKLGLHYSKAENAQVAAWFEQQTAPR